MSLHARTLFKTQDIAPQLHSMGQLNEKMLRQIVRRGLTARRSCTAFHPPSYPGLAQWAETHVALREFTTPLGWRVSDEANFSRVISPDGRCALTVASGDRLTGARGPKDPSTKYARGSQTDLAIQANKTLSLFGPTDDATPPPHCETWILLLHADLQRAEVRFELSRPQAQDGEGRVVAWSRRIILPPIHIDAVTPPDDESGNGVIDVPVTRK